MFDSPHQLMLPRQSLACCFQAIVTSSLVAAVYMWVKPLDLEVACPSERGQVVWQLSLLLGLPSTIAAMSFHTALGRNGFQSVLSITSHKSKFVSVTFYTANRYVVMLRDILKTLWINCGCPITMEVKRPHFLFHQTFFLCTKSFQTVVFHFRKYQLQHKRCRSDLCTCFMYLHVHSVCHVLCCNIHNNRRSPQLAFICPWFAWLLVP